VAEKFKGSDANACAKIMSTKLTAENLKAVVLAAAGLPRDKPSNEGSFARIACMLELLSKSVWQGTFVGLKTVIETINGKLAGINGEVAEEGMVDVEEFFWETFLRGNEAFFGLRRAASRASSSPQGVSVRTMKRSGRGSKRASCATSGRKRGPSGTAGARKSRTRKAPAGECRTAAATSSATESWRTDGFSTSTRRT